MCAGAHTVSFYFFLLCFFFLLNNNATTVGWKKEMETACVR